MRILETVETKIKTGELRRTGTFDRATVDQEARTVDLSFSSEDPFRRFFGIEILDHSKKSVRLKRLRNNGPLLMDHDTRDQIGKVESVTLGDDRTGRAQVRFGKSARAEEIFKDVVDGIRGNVSVSYIVHKMKQEEVNDDAPDVFRVVDWEPLEISLVSVPADTTVGVGKSIHSDHETIVISNLEDEEMLKFKKEHEPNKDTGGGTATPAPAAPAAPVAEKTATPPVEINVDQIREDAVKAEENRVKEIIAIGNKIGVQDLAKKYITENKSADKFRAAVIEGMGATPVIDPSPAIGLTDKEAQRFSFLKAMNSCAEHKNLDAAPFEKEISQAVKDHFKMDRGELGFYVPWEVQNYRSLQQQRDLTVNVATAGGFLVDTSLMSMIELLRNSMIVVRMGAQSLDGLRGDMAFPKMTGGGTAYWLNEGAAPTESQQVLGQLAMTPKTVGAFTDISRKLLLQSSLDVENLVRTDLALILAIAKDLAAINGEGANGVPLGILNVTGIGAVSMGTPDGGAPTWGKIVDLETEVAIDNALLGSLGYLTNSSAAGKLKQTVKVTNQAQFIMEGPNQMDGFMSMNGYRAGISNQVPNNLVEGSSGATLSAIIFGNWRDLIIGNWGSLFVQVDPFTGGTSGTVRIVILSDTDTLVRHAESFSAAKDVITV